MKYISICSGIEAATVAWHGMGWQPLAFSEIEPFPSAVLGHHYPDVPNLGDMTDYLNWPEELLLECELLVGGTPCQAFSVAGKRESLGDERGNLSLVFCNLYHHINEIRRRHGRPPAIVVWENVPGVLSTKDNAFGCFLAGIMGLDEAVQTESGKWHKAGFLSGETVRVGYRIIDAQYFGVAQRRRRVFLVAVPCELVASFGERACPSEILSLRESVLGDPPARGAAWEGVARTTAASLTSSGRGVERCGESRGQDDVVVSCPATARTLTQRMHKGFDSTLDSQTPVVTFGEDVARTLSARHDSSPCADRGMDVVAFHPTQDPISTADGSTHSMGCGSKQGCCTQAVAFTAKDSGADASRDVSPTMRAMGHSGSHANGGGQLAVAFTKAKRAQSSTDDESWVPGEVAPTQNQFDVGDTRATTVVAFTQNTRDEVREINGDGNIAGALAANSGMHQTNYLAFKESQSGCRLGDVHATIDVNKGSRRVEGVVAIQQAMQVRRLTPTECERLQGFPDHYTDVTYRKKPAADGPRYKALGNSMAVPCMAYIGYRIEKATRGNI